MNPTYQPIVDNEFIILLAVRVQDDVTIALEEDTISAFRPVYQFIVFNPPYLYTATGIVGHVCLFTMAAVHAFHIKCFHFFTASTS